MAHATPNIIWIMCDQMRFDCAGFFGHPTVQTPHIDRLARDGVVFNNAYCASPVCSPARASWLTGLYPHAHGQLRNYSSPHREKVGARLNSGSITIGDILKNAGYRCGIAGPWHMGDDHLPQHGFTDFWRTYRYQGRYGDRFFEYLDKQGVSNNYIMKQLPTTIHQDVPHMHHGAYNDPREQRTTWTIDRGLEFLEQCDEQPWFLFLSVKDPHPVIVVPPELLELYPTDQIEMPKTWRDPLEGKPLSQLTKTCRLPKNIDDDAFRRSVAHYFALITHIDIQVGKVIDKLKQMSALDNTIIIFMSDHGEMLGAHGAVGKVLMYEESVRVPCIITHPATLPAGFRVDTPLAGVDLMPTLAELAGLCIEHEIDGRSVATAIQDSCQPKPQPIFSEICTWDALKFKSDTPDDLAATVMVRNGDHKFVWNQSELDELYNLMKDPAEIDNLIHEPSQSDRIGEMKVFINQMVQNTGPGMYDWCTPGP
ncbi:MAG: hypothetical protein CMJ20_09690 [Phycisphaeraceae bacterium]|nr:hypothetical protein [Phycisphaeraceae bacterium]